MHGPMYIKKGLSISNHLVISCFPIKILYLFLISLICDTCPTYTLVFFRVSGLKSSGDGYHLCISFYKI